MRIVILCCLSTLSLSALAADAGTQLGDKKVLTLAVARRMVAAAESAANSMHLRGVIAICDDGGWPIFLERMDDSAYIASAELAPAKARSAALFKKSTGVLEETINHGRIAAVTAREFIEMQGGDSHRGEWPGDWRYRSEFRHAGT